MSMSQTRAARTRFGRCVLSFLRACTVSGAAGGGSTAVFFSGLRMTQRPRAMLLMVIPWAWRSAMCAPRTARRSLDESWSVSETDDSEVVAKQDMMKS